MVHGRFQAQPVRSAVHPSLTEPSSLPRAPAGYCAGMVHGHFQAQPVRSAVHLNFSCNVILVKKRAVVATFERAIHVYSRPVDPAIETGAHQV
jgi:hypothetical protein